MVGFPPSSMLFYQLAPIFTKNDHVTSSCSQRAGTSLPHPQSISTKSYEVDVT